MKEGEPPEVEFDPVLDGPDGETYDILKFANGASQKAYLPLWLEDIAYLKHLNTLPKSYRTFVEHEKERIAAKWRKEPEQPCKQSSQQPRRKKPRNYTDYDVGGEDE